MACYGMVAHEDEKVRKAWQSRPKDAEIHRLWACDYCKTFQGVYKEVFNHELVCPARPPDPKAKPKPAPKMAVTQSARQPEPEKPAAPKAAFMMPTTTITTSFVEFGAIDWGSTKPAAAQLASQVSQKLSVGKPVLQLGFESSAGRMSPARNAWGSDPAAPAPAAKSAVAGRPAEKRAAAIAAARAEATGRAKIAAAGGGRVESAAAAGGRGGGLGTGTGQAPVDRAARNAALQAAAAETRAKRAARNMGAGASASGVRRPLSSGSLSVSRGSTDMMARSGSTVGVGVTKSHSGVALFRSSSLRPDCSDRADGLGLRGGGCCRGKPSKPSPAGRKSPVARRSRSPTNVLIGGAPSGSGPPATFAPAAAVHDGGSARRKPQGQGQGRGRGAAAMIQLGQQARNGINGLHSGDRR